MNVKSKKFTVFVQFFIFNLRRKCSNLLKIVIMWSWVQHKYNKLLVFTLSNIFHFFITNSTKVLLAMRSLHNRLNVYQVYFLMEIIIFLLRFKSFQ